MTKKIWVLYEKDYFVTDDGLDRYETWALKTWFNVKPTVERLAKALSAWPSPTPWANTVAFELVNGIGHSDFRLEKMEESK